MYKPDSSVVNLCSVNWPLVSFFSWWVCAWIIWLINSSLTTASTKRTSKPIDNKLKALTHSCLSYQTHFPLPHLSTRWSPVLECLYVCVCMTTLVCFSDGSNAGMQYWMAEGERGRHSKVYKIIWSSSAFLCTVRLCSSIPLHPPPHQVLDQELRWLSLCCVACRDICLPLVILTTAGCWFSFIVYPRNDEAHDET